MKKNLIYRFITSIIILFVMNGIISISQISAQSRSYVAQGTQLFNTGPDPVPPQRREAQRENTFNKESNSQKRNSSSATAGFLTTIEQTIGLRSGLETPGDIVSALYPYIFVFAGLVLFVMLIWGGFDLLAGATDTKAQEAGKQRITWAVVGFLVLFTSYWAAQIIQILFGINILQT